MTRAPSSSKPKPRAKRSMLGPLALIAAATGVAAGGYYYLDQRETEDSLAPNWIPTPSPPSSSAAPSQAPPTEAPSSSIAEALQALAREAAAANAPRAEALAAAAAQAAQLDAATHAEALGTLARGSSTALAAALERESGERTARIAKLAPWADRPTASATAPQRAMAAALHRDDAAVATGAANVRAAGEPQEAVTAARAAVAAYARFISTYARAYTLARATPSAPERPAKAAPAPLPLPTPEALSLSAAGLAARTTQFKDLHSSAKAIAAQVIAMARAAKPRSSDGEAAQAAYRLRQDNAARARQYTQHLDALARSLRGAKTDAAAQKIIAQGQLVRGYLVILQARSSAAMPRR